MMKTEMNVEAGTADAELVTQSREGNRDAFGQIVSRYQSVICSLAYSATGSLGQSEDLAQETFITAWQHLRHLREPGKLRAWLCGIARNRISNRLRREGRQPLHAAESLESVAETPSTQPLPSEQAISKEEAAILWHSIEHIPETFREPLVLFYREGESVERVAAALDISEDAVRQRLSRGRKLLHEQVLALVEGTLRQTVPDKTFTVGVLAALPLVATTAKAATAGTVVKGSSTVKTFIGLATLGTLLLFYSVAAFLVFLGGCAGYAMSRTCANSHRQCETAIRFWRAVAVSFAACLSVWLIIHLLGSSPALVGAVTHVTQDLVGMFGGWVNGILWAGLFCAAALAAMVIWIRRRWGELSPRRLVVCLSLGVACLAVWLIILWSPSLGVMRSAGESLLMLLGGWESGIFLWANVFCIVVMAAWLTWMRRWWLELSRQNADTQPPARQPRKRLVFWLSLGLVAPVCLSVLSFWMLFVMVRMPAEKFLSVAEVQQIVTERKDARFEIMRAADGSKTLNIYLPDDGGRFSIRRAAADEPMFKLLDENRVAHPTFPVSTALREGVWPLYFLLPVFVASMGAVMLLRQTGKGRWETTAPETTNSMEQRKFKPRRLFLEIRTNPMTRRIFGIVFGVVFLLVLSLNGHYAMRDAANPICALDFAMALYVVLFVGLAKGAFLGLVAAVGALYVRAQRKLS